MDIINKSGIIKGTTMDIVTVTVISALRDVEVVVMVDLKENETVLITEWREEIAMGITMEIITMIITTMDIVVAKDVVNRATVITMVIVVKMAITTVATGGRDETATAGTDGLSDRLI